MGCLLEFIFEILIEAPAELLGNTIWGKVKDKIHNKPLRILLSILIAILCIVVIIGLLCLSAFLIEWFLSFFE